QPHLIEDHFNLLMSKNSLIESASPRISPESLPHWFDGKLFERGQRFAKRELAALSVAYLYGSAAALMIPSVGKVFIATKRTSSACLAFKRYFSSALFFYCFHMSSYKDPQSKFYKAIFTIRHMHALANKKVQRDYGYGISLRDMALVQFTFIAFILVKPKSIGLKLNNGDKEGINHFWRVVGHLLGIPDRKNASETSALGEKIMSEVLKVHAESLTADSKSLLRRLFGGFNDVIPLFHRDACLKLMYEAMGSKCECQNCIITWYRPSLTFH
ncbi:hypothetical protein QAD02_009895, partial [Eretmocerus hayati]